MATIKASNQVDLLDMTDGYTVVLTNDNYTFLGTTTSVDGTQQTATQVMAFLVLLVSVQLVTERLQCLLSQSLQPVH